MVVLLGSDLVQTITLAAFSGKNNVRETTLPISLHLSCEKGLFCQQCTGLFIQGDNEGSLFPFDLSQVGSPPQNVFDILQEDVSKEAFYDKPS